MVSIWWIIGAVNGFMAVALGAFGAHGLHDRLVANQRVEIWQTAVSYQMYHALALLGVAWLTSQAASASANAAGWCLLAGIVLFSGSLYALALSNLKVLGAITPVGGVLFLVGWVLLAVAGVKLR